MGSHLMEALAIEDVLASGRVQPSLDEEPTQVSHQPPVYRGKVCRGEKEGDGRKEEQSAIIASRYYIQAVWN